ncbi:Phosphorylated adapter RNA export protein, RNA-binding domain containing protein [Parasponia andersonii]|uniref:Phosphorylated adapter RNA export protein n=1 Tax=Parasponia andersonii TaxID=3476 RepID=A0A2P5DTR5_PARAD|nr:Phosphorylated adapter RNA export protein, RNA-binding domain containing protein [Parasponia andersonii]
MEGGESILDALNEVEIFEDDEDVEMLDVEEGELVEAHNSHNDLGESNVGDLNVNNKESQSKNRRRRANKKKNKRKGSGPGPYVGDIDRFVIDTCRHLKEKKSYMVYTAVGCLGVSALSDLIKEVDAVQACGGQMTADGRRFRTGGGILWSIIKTREPKAYKEIMNKAKEFEKQFKRPNLRQATEQGKDGTSQKIADDFSRKTLSDGSDRLQDMSEMKNQNEPSNDEEKRVSVHERLRVPVSYDDDLLGGGPKDSTT